jgi:opacity protein-like surface antigen
VTPLEISAGWRFRVRKLPKLIPYIAGGLTSMRYQETSDFSTPAEDVDESFGGYHLLGGAEYKITRWLGVAGEASWTTVPDAIGEAGVSEAFNETDLGGTTLRLKITIGR